MTDEQRIEAILELAGALGPADLFDLEADFEDLREQWCEKFGHQIGYDHCGREEHRFCRNCHTSETTIKARQAKANEATDCKSVLPSVSLGSGSIHPHDQTADTEKSK